jgi:hypothetical protein
MMTPFFRFLLFLLYHIAARFVNAGLGTLRGSCMKNEDGASAMLSENRVPRASLDRLGEWR